MVGFKDYFGWMNISFHLSDDMIEHYFQDEFEVDIEDINDNNIYYIPPSHIIKIIRENIEKDFNDLMELINQYIEIKTPFVYNLDENFNEENFNYKLDFFDTGNYYKKWCTIKDLNSVFEEIIVDNEKDEYFMYDFNIKNYINDDFNKRMCAYLLFINEIVDYIIMKNKTLNRKKSARK